jgi:Zn-dependent protease
MIEAGLPRPTHCPDCGGEVAPGLLACPACRRLVYAEELKRLSADAERAARAGDLTSALSAWRGALDLLPPDSRQHEVVSSRVADLSRQVDARGGVAKRGAEKKPAWAARAGVLGGLLLILWKFKFAVAFVLTKGKLLLLGLTKGGTLFSMLLSLGIYWRVFGWKWAAGVVASIYVHEMGHVAMLRRFGIPATAPMFIPGLGAVIRSRYYPTDVIADARVGLAGPVWGLAAAAACYAVYLLTGSASWGALARVGAWINLFNLIPIYPLDGGHGFRALTRRQRWLASALIGVAWLATGEGLLLLILIAALAVSAAGRGADRPDWRAAWEYYLLVSILAALTRVPVAVEALR